MTLSSSTGRWDYTGNGTTATYAYNKKIFSEDDIVVAVLNTTTNVETTLVKTTDYTVTGVGNVSGGTIVLVDAGQAWIDGSSFLATGYSISIVRNLSLVQETDLRNQGPYFREIIEDQFDKCIMIDQQQQDDIDRSIKVPLTSSARPVLPSPQDGYIIQWSGSGGNMINVAYDAASLTAAITAAQTAQTAAETAKTGAQTAQTNAETAELGAVTAKNAAIVAQTAAETAQAAAEAAVASISVFVDRGDPSAADYNAASLTKNGSWHDLDLSSVVPAGATSVLLRVTVNHSLAEKSINFRKNGNTNSVNVAGVINPVAGVSNVQDIVVAVDSNRVIEYNAVSNATWNTLDIVIAGWWL